MSSLWSRSPGRRVVLTTVVDLYGGSAAAVRITPAASRWPDHEGADRLALPVWFAALTLASAVGSVSGRIRFRVMELAAAIAADDDARAAGQPWTETVAVRSLVPPAHMGEPRVTVTLSHGSSGMTPAVEGGVASPISLAAAAAAASGVALEDHDHQERLSVALALEGLLIRHRETDPADWVTTQAVAAALQYALIRLEEVDRPVPSDLLGAASTWR